MDTLIAILASSFRRPSFSSSSTDGLASASLEARVPQARPILLDNSNGPASETMEGATKVPCNPSADLNNLLQKPIRGPDDPPPNDRGRKRMTQRGPLDYTQLRRYWNLLPLHRKLYSFYI